MYFEPNKMQPFVSPKKLAQMLGVSVRTLCRMRTEKHGPKFTKVGPRTILYRIEDVNEWLAANQSGLPVEVEND